MSNTPHSSFRLSAEVRKMLAALGTWTGETKTAVMERLVREAYDYRLLVAAGVNPVTVLKRQGVIPKRRASVRAKNREAGK